MVADLASRRRVPLAQARRAAGRLLGRLAGEQSALRLAVTGDLRRMAPRVEGIAVLATARDPEALLRAFLGLPGLAGTRAREGAVAMGRLEAAAGEGEEDLPVALKVLPDDEDAYAAWLLRLTADPSHHRALVARARTRGMDLGPEGLRDATGRRVEAPTEDALYAALGLPTFPPELREGPDLTPPPRDLVAMDAIRGLWRFATDAGQGRHDLPRMAARIRREGYAWGCLVHAGLGAAALAAQREAIAEATQEEGPPLRLFLGVVAGLDAGGRVDLDTEAAALADAVVLRPGAHAQATAQALSDPRIRVLAQAPARAAGAWTQNLEGWRPVLDACARADVALEMTADADTEPVPAGWHAAARERGLRVLPGTRARDLAGVEDACCGVGQARRGRWLRVDVLPALPVDEMATWLAGRAR